MVIAGTSPVIFNGLFLSSSIKKNFFKDWVEEKKRVPGYTEMLSSGDHVTFPSLVCKASFRPGPQSRAAPGFLGKGRGAGGGRGQRLQQDSLLRMSQTGAEAPGGSEKAGLRTDPPRRWCTAGKGGAGRGGEGRC